MGLENILHGPVAENKILNFLPGYKVLVHPYIGVSHDSPSTAQPSIALGGLVISEPTIIGLISSFWPISHVRSLVIREYQPR